MTLRRGWPPRAAWVYASIAAVAFLPFLRGVAAGHAFYFRDLSRYFFPLRSFVAEGLRRGELRFWNPYVHEGEPVLLSPFSYPLDLLQALLPHEPGLTLLLALHVPLAALALMLLARKGLGLSLAGAAAGGIVYGLGSFTLSCLNLYVYLQVVAWAPLLILGLLRAGEGDRRGAALAALSTALCLATTGVEMAAQAVLAGLALSWRRDSRAVYLLAPLALGVGLAAPALVTVSGLVEDSARAGGFPPEVALAHAIHPVTLLQTVVADLYGDAANVAGRWWGDNFFPRGFPYLLSLYLGLPTLCVAAAGLARPGRFRWRLLLLGVVALAVCLGPWAGLTPLVEAVPFVRRFRFPSKAFFSVHLSVALLAGLGVDALWQASRGAVRWVAASATAAGLVLVTAPTWPALAPSSAAWFVHGFFPPRLDTAARLQDLAHILGDAAVGGGLALAAGLVALLQLRGRLRPALGAAGVTVLVGADLLRAGSGLNPMVTPAFYRPSPEVSALAPLLREEGRLFTCDPGESDAYAVTRPALEDRAEVWTFALLRDTLTPGYNMAAQVRTALSEDLTMLVPTHRLLPRDTPGCRSADSILPRLQEAAVANVVSVEPVRHPSLRLRALLHPREMEPLPLYVYALDGPRPRWSVATGVESAATREEAERSAWRTGSLEQGRVVVEGAPGPVLDARGRVLEWEERPGAFDFSLEADRATAPVVREAHAPGWRATVDGRPAAVWRADGRYQAVPIPAGKSRVRLRYRPPHLGAAMAVSGLCALALVAAVRQPPRARPAG